MHRRCGALVASALVLALAACPYHFSGGGLPNVKTVAILPFDNQTPQPELTKDTPVALQPGRGQVSVTQRRVQISVDVEILDQREGKTLWQRQGLTVDGEYDPPKEADGRKIALSKLVNEIVDGAQSQW